MTALGYIRRSKESGQRTVSLEMQEAAIRQYAEANGLVLAEMLSDDGVSGGRRQRLVRIEAAVKRHRARVVVVYHLDRYARDVAAQLDALRAYSRRGVELHVVGRGRVEIETEAGFLLTGVEGLMAEAFRRSVSKKTKDALARLRASGRRAGNVPYGHTLAGDQRTLVPEAHEQGILARLRARRAEGASFGRIAQELNAAGIATRGGGRWWTETVRSILAHAVNNHRSVVVEAAVA